ncbi:aconitase X swivel domain-containing protein [Rhodococcus sp. IEGM1428]|uniref:aconitase X swivel domain-containing protein n=1 Tax=Rhodococcus sp. IEGM1428 TaxID=3392191 RepID=UPI003D11DAFC
MPASEARFAARSLTAGSAHGQAVKLTEPLNAWGELDPKTGVIVHQGHPQHGKSLAGKVLVMWESRGSGANAQVFAQVWANEKGPVGIILAVPDYVLCVGAVVSNEVYGISCPIVVLDANDYDDLIDGNYLTIDSSEEGATVTVQQ